MNECRTGGTKLRLVRLRQAAEHALAVQRQLHEDLSAVSIALAPNDQIPANEPVEQADHGVMLHLQPVREGPYRRAPAFREPFESEKQLVLLGFHTCGATLFFAEDHEETQLVSELRQGSVIERRVPWHSATRALYHIVARYNWRLGGASSGADRVVLEWWTALSFGGLWMAIPKWIHCGWLLALGLVSGVSCGGSDSTGFSRGKGGAAGDAAATGGSDTDGSSGGATATGGSSTASGGDSGSGSGGRSSGGSSTGADGGGRAGGGAGGVSDGGDASPTGDSAATGGSGGVGFDAGTCASPTTFFADADGDKFGDAQTTTKACAKPPGYVENSDDCYDDNASAKPGQTGWFKVDRGDGSYDYDCDKSEAQHWAATGNCGFAICALKEGWQTVVPPCGTDGQWITQCVPLAICAVSQTMPRTQECH